MSYTLTSTYQKLGAIFSDGEAAHADKNSLFPTELQASVDACYADMMSKGILLAPISYTWDQDSYTLTIIKQVISREEYMAAVTFTNADVVGAASSAGWVYIPQN